MFVSREALAAELDRVRAQVGRLNAQRVRLLPVGPLADAEFQVFSQWGEDGIIQYLVGKVPMENELFVEFGVESYAESNTRFLLENNGWRGVIIDAGRAHVAFANRRGLTWRHDLTPVSAFITRENINRLLSDAGARGDIGILSVDIDGNDYWVCDAIDVVSPRILITEYNATFGPDRAVTVPYRSDFTRREAHYSGLYYGASLAALAQLAQRRGYELVGCNSAGNNAFFVRRDVMGPLQSLTVRQAFVQSRFRESRAPDGRLTYLRTRAERLREIADLPVVDVTSGKSVAIRELFEEECGGRS